MKVNNDHRSKFPNLSNWKEGIAEVTDSNPVEALIFQAFSFQLLTFENLLR